MKMKAAVCREFNKPISIEEVELAPPKEKEVLVKKEGCLTFPSYIEDQRACPK